MCRCGEPSCLRRCRWRRTSGWGSRWRARSAARSWRCRSGRRPGSRARDLKDAYFVALLRHVGCTADAPIAADLFGGDEIAARGYLALVDQGKPTALVAALVRNLGAGESPLQRARLLANALVKMPRLAAAVACALRGRAVAGRRARAVRPARARGAGVHVRAVGRQGRCRARSRARRSRSRCAWCRSPTTRNAFHPPGGIEGAVAMLGVAGRRGAGPDAGGDGARRARRCSPAWTCRRVDWDAAIAAEPGAPDYIDDDRRGQRAAGDGRVRGSEVVVHARAFDGRRRAGGGRRRAAGAVGGRGRGGAPRRLRARRGARGRRRRRVGEGRAARRTANGRRCANTPATRSRSWRGRRCWRGWARWAPWTTSGWTGPAITSGRARSLPPGARVLAVADMYQAMRETRPHRRSIPASEVAAVLDREVDEGAPRSRRGERRAADRRRPVARGRGRVAPALSGRPVRRGDRRAPVGLARSVRTAGRRRAGDPGAARSAGTWQFAYEKIGVTTRARRGDVRDEERDRRRGVSRGASNAWRP